MGDVIAQLFAKRAIAGPLETEHLAQAWSVVCGPAWSHATRVATLKDEVLVIEVHSSSLLFELDTFHKHRLLEALRQQPVFKRLRGLRFQAGGGS